MNDTQMANEMNENSGNADSRVRRVWEKPSLDHFSFKEATSGANGTADAASGLS